MSRPIQSHPTPKPSSNSDLPVAWITGPTTDPSLPTLHSYMIWSNTTKSFSNLAASQFCFSRSNKSTTTLQFRFLQGCMIVALQGCVIVALQGCIIVALQGCVIVVLQDCVIVALQGCAMLILKISAT
jgi:hypothetical protein